MKKPITDKIKRLRQRLRSDGSWRIWWEPEADLKAVGFTTVDLDEKRLTWSKREATRLNKDVDTARTTGAAPTRGSGDRSMMGLIRLYKASRDFRKLAPKTQASYRGNLNIIERKWGESHVSDFTKPIVHTWYEANYEQRGPTQALSLNRTLSILFEFAERNGWRDENTNPSQRIKAEIPRGRTRRLSWDESDALIDAAHALGWHNMAVAIGLSLYQGQRQTDVRQAKPTDFTWFATMQAGTMTRTLVWTLTRSKRSNMGATPIHDEIAGKVAELLLDRSDDAPALLIDEATNLPYSEGLICKRFEAIRTAACKRCPALRDVQFRDLRRTFGGRARAGGASKDDTADVLGNSAATNPQLAEIYMATQLETASRAVSATKRPQKD